MKLISALIFVNQFCFRDSTAMPDFDFIQILTSIQDHFCSSWVIIQCCEKTDYSIVQLSKKIQRSTNAYISSFVWEDFVVSANKREDRSFRPIVLLSCWSCSRDCFSMINVLAQENIMEKFIWLAILNDSSSETIDVNIPVDSLLIVVTPRDLKETNHFILWEIYRVSTDSELLRMQLGTWSSLERLNITRVPFEERRSDFMGKKVVTLMEPKDSLNRLIGVYNHYALSYFDMAKRMNFSIQKITDPKEAFEISILPQWMEKEDELVYLQPLYTSWQAIFFKDVGTSMQLDGYLKPFQAEVWLAIVCVTLMTGVASYVAARALNWTTNRLQARFRVENYIYQSFYILLQKSEGTEPFITSKIIALSQWLVSIFLLSCYSAIFISFISVVIPKPPFTTIDGILKEGSHNIVQSKHISAVAVDFLKNSGDEKLRRLYEYHFDPRTNLRESAVDDFCQNQNYLLITSETHIKKVKASREYRNCRISSTRIRVSLRHLSWSLNNASHMTKFFRMHLSKLHLAGALQSSFIKKQTYRMIPEGDSYRRINLKDVVILFIILAAGLFISFLIMVIEAIHKEGGIHGE